MITGVPWARMGALMWATMWLLACDPGPTVPLEHLDFTLKLDATFRKSPHVRVLIDGKSDEGCARLSRSGSVTLQGQASAELSFGRVRGTGFAGVGFDCEPVTAHFERAAFAAADELEIVVDDSVVASMHVAQPLADVDLTVSGPVGAGDTLLLDLGVPPSWVEITHLRAECAACIGEDLQVSETDDDRLAVVLPDEVQPTEVLGIDLGYRAVTTSCTAPSCLVFANAAFATVHLAD